MFNCSIKFTYQRRLATNCPPILRRASIESASSGRPIEYERVQQLAKQLYSIDDQSSISFTWTDEDNDVITMSSQMEFDECVMHLCSPANRSRQPNILKLGLLVKNVTLNKADNSKECATLPAASATANPEKSCITEKAFIQRRNLLNEIKSTGVTVDTDAEKSLTAQPLANVDIAAACPVPCSQFKKGALHAIAEDAKGPVLGAGKQGKMVKKVMYLQPTAPPDVKVEVLSSINSHSVLPGDQFKQTWTVRNTGSIDAEALTLSPASGTLIRIAGTVNTGMDTCQYNIGSIQAGRSKRIILNLVAPSSTGTHSAQFTLADRTGMRVATLDVAVDVPVTKVELSEPSVAAPATIIATAPPAVPVPNSFPDIKGAQSTSSPAPFNALRAPITAPGPASTITQPMTRNQAHKMWAAELQVLKRMGFTDDEINIPLLEKHVQFPSRSATRSNIGQVALSDIVTELISLSAQWKEDEMSKDEAVVSSPIDVGSGDDEEEDFVFLLGDGDHY